MTETARPIGSGTVILAVADGVATITLNRPEVLHAFNPAMGADLLEALLTVDGDAAVRAVLLTGSGRAFMAGGDLAHLHGATGDERPRAANALVGAFHEIVLAMARLPKPIVAGINGVAAGAGVSMAMACDLVVMAAEAKLVMAYTGIGATPDGGSTFALPRLIGPKLAMEMLLLNEPVDAETARAWGLVNRIVPAAEVPAEAMKLAAKLAAGPTLSYARTRRLVSESLDNPLGQQLAREQEAFVANSRTHDFDEGLGAFLAKRKPGYEGR